jgi:hypothetical protein
MTISPNYLVVEGLVVLLPPPQPTTDTTPRARTSATRIRFIVNSSSVESVKKVATRSKSETDFRPILNRSALVWEVKIRPIQPSLFSAGHNLMQYWWLWLENSGQLTI